MNIALLGGTFDPPHLAHRQVAEYLLNSKRFDEIWLIPAKQNPLKPTHSSFADRMEMCRLAFEDLGASVKILDVDRQLTGFTIDLANHLLKAYPGHRFTFIGGSDLKKELDQWKEAEALKGRIQMEFLPRPPDKASPFLDISSTEIRDRVKNHLSVDHLVAKAVKEYIETRNLYTQPTVET